MRKPGRRIGVPQSAHRRTAGHTQRRSVRANEHCQGDVRCGYPGSSNSHSCMSSAWRAEESHIVREMARGVHATYERAVAPSVLAAAHCRSAPSCSHNGEREGLGRCRVAPARARDEKFATFASHVLTPAPWNRMLASSFAGMRWLGELSVRALLFRVAGHSVRSAFRSVGMTPRRSMLFIPSDKGTPVARPARNATGLARDSRAAEEGVVGAGRRHSRVEGGTP